MTAEPDTNPAASTPPPSTPSQIEETAKEPALFLPGLRADLDPIETIIATFLNRIRGIGRTAGFALPHAAKWRIDKLKSTEERVANHIPGFPEPEETEVAIDGAHAIVDFMQTLGDLIDLAEFDNAAILARSLFLQIFSEFDAYMGALLKALYLRNSDLLKGISREISLCDLLEFSDLEAAKRAMLDKEIDSFRRDSYIEQFANLEKKFGVTLRKFAEWSEFVELGQRRNLLTHNDGLVNDQYLIVCDREKHTFAKRPALGEQLSIDPPYLTKALRVLSMTGLMLGYTLWMKVVPADKETIHHSLNNTLYRELGRARWKFVSSLKAFALSDPMCKGISDMHRRIRLVNIAIAAKFSKDEATCASLLGSIDWSASVRDFKLAVAVLKDDFEEAASLMVSIGKSGEIISQESYHAWPLFSRFREDRRFAEAYVQVYGEAFVKKLQTTAAPVAEAALVAARKSEIAGGDSLTVDVEAVRIEERAQEVTDPSIAGEGAREFQGENALSRDAPS
jgi:hypothetical protein